MSDLLISFSRNYKETKKYSKEVFEFKGLLKYDLNPRTKKFHRVCKMVGIKGLCKFIRLYEKIRHNESSN